MVENSPKTPPKRVYPKFFEKSIPIAIVILITLIIGMLVFGVAVILGIL